MALPLPSTLSPSKVSSFTDCALAFRFSAIDRLPEPPSPAATKGTLVHAALEKLFCLPPTQRTVATALTCLDTAVESMRDHPDLVGLELDDEGLASLLDDAEQLVRRYFELEDPAHIEPIGLELSLEVTLGSLRLRGIIDRLELDADGNLVVTDYKTGRAPNADYERTKLGGVQFYSFLCERLLGVRPAKVQLLYLSEPVALVASPTEQSTRALERKVSAVWAAIERACEREDFRPKPSKLCAWCAFQQYCPAYGGDPSDAPRDMRRSPTNLGEVGDRSDAPSDPTSSLLPT
ncbi:MAG: PD-(D/E)XK nuclease family protein [Acidimicrobiales bacterium]|nr:PD-(D/E)XK nuclease family protein [Acidimicrobiales bacterium]